MADLSIELASRLGSEDLRSEFLRVIDAEGKIPAALDALATLSGRDVVVLDGERYRAEQFHSLGARVRSVGAPNAAAGSLPAGVTGVVGTPESTGLADTSADAVVSFWAAFHGPNAAQLAEADRILRPGGRLLIVHDYGRDDVCRLWPEAFAQQIEWSRRNGPFLAVGFRIRVIHCWWTFDSMDHAKRLLGEAFGEEGRELLSLMKRPRLEYNISIYHRSKAGLPA